MKKTELKQIIREEIQRLTENDKKQKQKIVNLLIKYGNRKDDAIKMVDKHYDYVIDVYGNDTPNHKRAEIISSLRGLGY